MRYAVCISGALRGDLNNLSNIYLNICEPLNADVFLTTWDHHYKWAGILNLSSYTAKRYFGTKISEMIPPEYRTYEKIRDEFPLTFEKLSKSIINPVSTHEIINYIPSIKKLEILNEEAVTEFINSYFSDYLELYQTDKKVNQFKMFALMYLCDNSLSSYEKLNNFKYDIVIHIRPDYSISNKIDFSYINTINDNQIMARSLFCGIDDVMFICKRQTMISVCSIWEKMLLVKRLSPFKLFYNTDSHFLLLLWCISKGIKHLHDNSRGIFDCDQDFLYKGVSPYFPAFHELLMDIQNSSHREQYCNLEKYIKSQLF